MLNTGLKTSMTMRVTGAHTALAVGSGTLEVFATPMLAALMEETAWRSVAPYLEDGQSSVGTRLELDHLAATPVGMKVTCESTLTEVDGRTLIFTITAHDAKGLIGQARHTRVIIDAARFMSKAVQRAE